MRLLVTIFCVFCLVGAANADDMNRYREHIGKTGQHKVERQLMRQMRELKQMLADMQIEIREIKRIVRHRNRPGLNVKESWGCSIQPPWDEPAYFGVGRTKALATQEALDRCVSGARLDNRKYCQTSRASCSKQR